MDWEDECRELSAQLQHVQEAYEALCGAHREVVGRYDVARRTHEWAYRRWWRRLFLPIEPTPGRELMRCRTCYRLFWSDRPEAHIGHMSSLATDGSWWEFIRVKLGWL